MNNKKMLDFQTIAVDFDGTLCYSKWPELGQPNQALIEYLQEWKRNGNKLILWTCRAGEALSNAVEWCREQNLEFDAINDNLPEIIEFYGHNSRKISCDYYIDDRMLLRKTQRHRTRNGAMPLCLFWHSFLVSAGYLPNTVFLIIKICWLNFFKFCYFIR